MPAASAVAARSSSDRRMVKDNGHGRSTDGVRFIPRRHLRRLAFLGGYSRRKLSNRLGGLLASRKVACVAALYTMYDVTNVMPLFIPILIIFFSILGIKSCFTGQ